MSKAFPKFQEYLNSRGKVLEKGKVNDTGDCLEDTPTPKAPEDPRKKNKSQGKQPQVKEFLNQQGKMVDKPVVEPVADYRGPDPKSPPGSDKPYRAAGQGTGRTKSETGFGDMGDQRLAYQPDVKLGDSPHVPGGKSAGGWENKTKTESFIDRTKNMTFSEFTEHMLQNGGFQANEAIRYIVALANQNEQVLESLVHEMKRSNLLHSLMEHMLEYKESYGCLNELLGDGERGARRCYFLAKSMNEAVGPPMADLEDEDEPIEPPEGDEEDALGDLEDEDTPPDDDLEGIDDEDDEEDDDEDEEDDEEMDDSEDLEGDEPPEEIGSAPDNILAAMSRFKKMRKAMRAY